MIQVRQAEIKPVCHLWSHLKEHPYAVLFARTDLHPRPQMDYV